MKISIKKSSKKKTLKPKNFALKSQIFIKNSKINYQFPDLFNFQNTQTKKKSIYYNLINGCIKFNFIKFITQNKSIF